MTARQAADLRLRQAAERLQRANDELIAAEREHAIALKWVEHYERNTATSTVEHK